MKEVIGILNDYSHRRYASRERAVEAGCKYTLGDPVPMLTWRRGSTRKVPVYPILDLDANRVSMLQEGRWKLHDFALPSGGHYIEHTFEDPQGELRRLELRYRQKEGIGRDIEEMECTLKRLSGFSSWAEYDMAERIEELAQENETLRQRVAELEEITQQGNTDA